MPKPINILYVDNGEESQQVEELLKSNDIEYERLESPNIKPPYLMSKEGDFKDLEGIQCFINLKKKVI